MVQSIAALTLVVRDYDEAITYFVNTLRFVLLEDTPLGNGKRWVRVAPSDAAGAALLLAKAVNDEQLAHAGNQTGGRVFLFLKTTNFWDDYQAMLARGVQFAEQPRHEPYGWVVVFYDLYGNKWDLVEQQ